MGCAGTAKIADVGLARIMQHTMSNTATGDPAGTFAYAAPEMLMGEKWDDKVGCCPACVSVCLSVADCVCLSVCLSVCLIALSSAESCSAVAEVWALVQPTVSLFIYADMC